MRKCVFHKISSSGDWRKASVTCSLNLFLVIINQSEELEFHHRLESSSKPKTPRRSCLVSKKRTGKKPLFSFWQVFFSFPLSLSLDPLCRPADGRHAGEDEGGQSADRGTGCTYSCSQQKRLTRGKKKRRKGSKRLWYFCKMECALHGSGGPLSTQYSTRFLLLPSYSPVPHTTNFQINDAI